MVQLETSFKVESEGQLLCKRKNNGWRARTEAWDFPTGSCVKLKGLAPDHTDKL